MISLTAEGATERELWRTLNLRGKTKAQKGLIVV